MQIIHFEIDYAPDAMPVEREAKIFEVGEYADKGISIGEDDLDRIVENFTEVPVKVEHTDSPLDPLGTVRRIWRKGGELFASLAFPSDLASFLERRGVKKLSVALLKDPLRLAEISLVLSPRVASAAMFGSEISDRGEVNEVMSDDLDKELIELRFALRTRDVDARLAALKAQGKIVPASESLAREILLQANERITFGDQEVSIAEMFDRFLDAQPKVVEFGELTPGSNAPASPLSADEEELLDKLGMSREQIERYA